MDTVWLDVQMWTPMRGRMHPFTTVVCDAPDPAPRTTADWQTWAAAYLEIVAGKDDWQPGRYHYTAELRDDGGRTAQVFTRGQWNWRT
jgi:hypothetical protein